VNAQVHSIGPQTRKKRKNALFRSEYFPDSLFSMSAIGTKRTWTCALHMSAFGGKADILQCRGCAGRFGSPSRGVILFQWLTGVCKNSTAALFYVKQYSSKALS
jgi:hypothetical protein